MKLHIVRSGSGDWEGLYIDNDLIVEDHYLDVSDVLAALKKYFNFEFDYNYSTDNDLDRYGNGCPATFEEFERKEKIDPNDLLDILADR